MRKKRVLRDYLSLRNYLDFVPKDMLCHIDSDNYEIYGHVKMMYEHLPSEVMNGRVMNTEFKGDVSFIKVKEISTAD